MDFKIRTCSKISELSQVIHMLFTQNHEKDVIIKEFKTFLDEYQNQIEEKLQTVQSCQLTLSEHDKISILNDLNDQFLDDERKIREYYESSVTFLQNELEKTISNCLKAEKLLTNITTKYDKLVLETSDKESSFLEEISSLKQEMNSLVEDHRTANLNHQSVVKKMTHLDSEHKIKMDYLKNENMKLNSQNILLKEESAHFENKCKEMEMELKSISSQLNKQKIAFHRSETVPSMSQKISTIGASQVTDELRKELIRYKLELSNRDSNFTKLFANNYPRIQKPPNHKRPSQSEERNKFNELIDISQRHISNVTVKIVSAQYDNRKALPRIQ